MKLYGPTGRSNRVKAVAGWTGVPLEQPPFTMGVTNRTPEFLAKNPFGKVTTPEPQTPNANSKP
jgi:glutathione S-transferase